MDTSLNEPMIQDETVSGPNHDSTMTGSTGSLLQQRNNNYLNPDLLYEDEIISDENDSEEEIKEEED